MPGGSAAWLREPEEDGRFAQGYARMTILPKCSPRSMRR
jgi:hypothetical protein